MYSFMKKNALRRKWNGRAWKCALFSAFMLAAFLIGSPQTVFADTNGVQAANMKAENSAHFHARPFHFLLNAFFFIKLYMFG